jgi:hypothetical protein
LCACLSATDLRQANFIDAELRRRDLASVLFDFDRPVSRDLTQTISTLARMARFIVADITDPRSILQELQAIVPNLASVPLAPLIHTSQTEYEMFERFTRYPWVLTIYRYDDQVGDLVDEFINDYLAANPK